MTYIKAFEGVELFENTFRHQINKTTGKIENREFVFSRKFGNGKDEWPVEADRYRLIWMPGCPHSNKATITARLLGLDKVISIGTTGILRDPRGWVFSEDENEVDPVLGVYYLDDIYKGTDPDFVGRSTVPLIAEEATKKAVNNDPLHIPTYFARDWKAFHKENAPDLYPEGLEDKINKANDWILKEVNAYACGFARDQEHYEKGFKMFFDALDQLEEHLSDKRFLFGDYITLSDIHLYVALVRFQVNYHLVFRVNKKRLEDYPSLWAYTRDLYQTDGFREYTKLDLIKKHYQLSPHMRALQGNVYGIYALGPDSTQWEKPAGREKLSKDPDEKFRYEKEVRPEFQHNNAELEVQYIKEYLIHPIERAGAATNQGEYERWFYLVFDELKTLDHLLKGRKYLLGDAVTEADSLLYQTLLRLDHIYYYVYKLNQAKSTDYDNLKRYLSDLSEIPEIKNSIDPVKEREVFYQNQNDVRNPYHIISKGPEEGL